MDILLKFLPKELVYKIFEYTDIITAIRCNVGYSLILEFLYKQSKYNSYKQIIELNKNELLYDNLEVIDLLSNEEIKQILIYLKEEQKIKLSYKDLKFIQIANSFNLNYSDYFTNYLIKLHELNESDILSFVSDYISNKRFYKLMHNHLIF